ncbi:hypothetical protein Hanom_Chr09g00788801 [Helianthus anomalus]
MLFDRLAYWVLSFERFLLVGLCYLCTFSGQRRYVFVSNIGVCCLIIVAFVCSEVVGFCAFDVALTMMISI